jgi:hypothetical protein
MPTPICYRDCFVLSHIGNTITSSVSVQCTGTTATISVINSDDSCKLPTLKQFSNILKGFKKKVKFWTGQEYAEDTYSQKQLHEIGVRLETSLKEVTG